MSTQQEPLAFNQYSDFSFQFGRFISEQSNSDLQDPAIKTAIGLIEQQQKGNACLDLKSWANHPLPLTGQNSSHCFHTPDLETWKKILANNSCVGKPDEPQPLILDNNRLYLQRYYCYETFIAECLLNKAATKPVFDPIQLDTSLNKLFSESNTDSGQKKAAIKAIEHSFCVVSGGPGTGKTTTIVKILALLLDQNSDLQIGLAAPTGKAAARMSESILRRIDDYGLDHSVKSRIPTTASTIHRLLGYRRNGYHYNHNNPLHLDCLVIDEASMLDLALMNHLLEALPGQCRLILLGDRDQLASVAAGNVLADITGQAQKNEVLRPSMANRKIGDCIALLDKSFRFAEGRGISELSKQVNSGNSDAVINLLDDKNAEFRWIQPDSSDPNSNHLTNESLNFAIKQYQPIFESDNVVDAMQVFDSMRVLSAQHEGMLGVEAINRQISSYFLRNGLIGQTEHFRGQPILIGENYYDLQLFNGDTGLIWPDKNGKLMAWFSDSDGELRSLRLSLLPQIKTAWAMTVHKAQGSEFDSILLVAEEPENNQVLTRSWLYTAITRARHSCYLQIPESTIRQVCQQVESRQSGLAERLGW